MAEDEARVKHSPDEKTQKANSELSANSAETQPVPVRIGVGFMLGSYQLLEKIGEGGMGEVWVAEQKQPVRRRVAIKLIKAGMDTREVVARFESERQALALMDHPTIAKVFEAGSTAEGRPYFVMEYVAGVPITDYCDRHKFDIHRRLQLLIAVCEGVQHAHQKAIIHRDLKPSNILVTELDGKPVPHIIDFGVAKATSRSLNDDTIYTQFGMMIGTLGYMSPEQADSGGEDIDTRSDVYSLGVILYELLSGRLPFDFQKLAYAEVLRSLREQDAPSPSTRLRTLGANSAIVAKKRGATPATLVSQLKGDPDAITLKALEKDRARRYATPLDLAADLSRYMRNEPVSARAPSAVYRARKYVRRHRFGVALVSLLLLLLMAFAIAQSIQLQRIRRERNRADRITEFMMNMFKVPSPSEARGNTVTAREILDKSSYEIGTALGQDVEARAQLMLVMARTYANLGLYSRAHDLTERVIEDRRNTLGADDPKTLEAMSQMGWILYEEGRDVEAEQLLRKTIDVASRVLGPADPLTLQTRDYLARILIRQAHFTEAEKLERELIVLSSRKPGPEDPQTLQFRSNLADALARQSRFTEAENEYAQVLNVERRVLGPNHPSTLTTMHNLANTFLAQGDYDAAEKLYRATLQIEEVVLGPHHPTTAGSMTALANTIRFRKGRAAEAENLYRKSLEILLRTVGADHPSTTRAQEGLANVLSSEDRYPEAEKLLKEVLVVRERMLGPTHTDTLITEYNLANILNHEGHYEEAEKLLRNTVKTQERVLDANDPDIMASRTLLASVLLAENRPEDAIPLARQAFDDQMRTLGPQHRDTQYSLGSLGIALTKTGRYEEARKLYLDTIQKVGVPMDTGNVSYLWYNLACLAAQTGHRNEAFDGLQRAIEAGFTDAPSMSVDDDLRSLRRDPRFDKLVASAKAASLAPVSSRK